MAAIFNVLNHRYNKENKHMETLRYINVYITEYNVGLD